jgi:hypothetical protein
VTFPTNKVSPALYADDAVINCSSKSTALAIKYVQVFFHKFEKWFVKVENYDKPHKMPSDNHLKKKKKGELKL